MQWKGLYRIIWKMGDQDYKILVKNKQNNYHVNILKKSYALEDKADNGKEKTFAEICWGKN